MGMKGKIALGAVVGLAIIGTVSANAGETTGGSGGKSPSVTAEQPGGAQRDGVSDAQPSGGKNAAKASRAEQFKAFVRKNGTAPEQEAVAHVTEVQGAEEQNDTLGTADIRTDLTGGTTGGGVAPARLIASAFADWKQSENGLATVTVHDADGELLGNGTF